MRVTESRMLDMAATSVANARDRAAQAQLVLSSGNRVTVPSDDPTAWAQGERAAVRMSMSSDRGQAIGLAVGGLQASDGSLATISTALSQLGALATQGANGTLDATARKSIADQVRALRDTTLAAMNQKGPDGTYMFSGSKSTTAPFTPAGLYVGDGAERTLQSAEGQTASGSVTGQSLTSASGGVDVLAVFDQLAIALDANDVPGIQASQPGVQSAVGQVAQMRSLVGGRLSALSSAEDARQSFEQNLAERHASAVEADPIAAASDLVRTSTALQSAQAAAQHVIAMLQQR
jgi:flagellar hook-associated protein 3 FlgL